MTAQTSRVKSIRVFYLVEQLFDPRSGSRRSSGSVPAAPLQWLRAGGAGLAAARLGASRFFPYANIVAHWLWLVKSACPQ